MPFNGVFSSGSLARGRVDRSLNEMRGALSPDGLFGRGQPRSEPYAFTDPHTGEAIRLWRTSEDEEDQAKYNVYRRVLKAGLREGLKISNPELFLTRNRQKTPEQPRAYDIPRLVSAALSDIVNGEGVEIKTNIDPLDEILEEMDLEAKLQGWTFEASVYKMVGLQVTFDFDIGAADIVRVLPDYLYPIKDDTNDELQCIAKRVFVPLEHVEKWIPLTDISRSRAGGPAVAQDRPAPRQSYTRPLNENEFDVVQTGFLFEEVHYKGWVEYHFYAISGNRIMADLPLELYDQRIAQNPVVLTGMTDFAITLYNNTGEDGEARSDWDGIYEESLDLARRATKTGQLVDTFSRPIPVVPANHVQVDRSTGKATWGIGENDVIVAHPTDHIAPSMLQPNANFDAPNQDYNNIFEAIGILSRARFAIDPTVMEGVSSGVGLKLKMVPALMSVKPRRNSQERSTRRLLYNLISGIEWHSSLDPRARPGYEKRAVDSVRFGGIFAAHVDKYISERHQAVRSAILLRFDNLAPDFAGVTTEHRSSVDPGNPPTGTDAKQFVLRARRQGHTVPEQVDPTTGQRFTPPQVIGANQLPRLEAPDAIDTQMMQRAADTGITTENIVALGDITVRFQPATPQDEVEARSEVVDGLRSRESYIREFRGLTQAETDEEMRLIGEDQSAAVNGMDAVDFGVDDPMNPAGPGPQQPATPQQRVSEITSQVDRLRQQALAAEQPGASPQDTSIGGALQNRVGEPV